MDQCKTCDGSGVVHGLKLGVEPTNERDPARPLETCPDCFGKPQEEEPKAEPEPEPEGGDDDDGDL